MFNNFGLNSTLFDVKITTHAFLLSFPIDWHICSFSAVLNNFVFSSVQFSSVAQSCPTLYDPMNCSTPGLPVHHQLPEFTQTQVHQVSDAIQPSHPLSSPSPPAPNPSQYQSLSNESTLRIRWPKYWSFSFSIIPSKEIPHGRRSLVGCSPWGR